MRVEGCVALVTGGAAGIGLHCAEVLAAEGASVALLDVDKKKGEAAAQLLGAKHGAQRVAFFECDVSRAENLKAAFERVVERFGRLDIVINNAGITENPEDLLSGAPEASSRLQRVIDINLGAVVEGTRLAILYMQRGGRGGAIVNVASMSGLLPTPLNPVYAATKHGVVGLSRSLSYLANEKDRIRVNCICPSFTDTSMVQSAMGESDLFSQTVATQGRLLDPKLVADGIMRLVADDNLAGEVMRVTAQKGIDFQPYRFPPRVPSKDGKWQVEVRPPLNISSVRDSRVAPRAKL
jgi:NAD(P)-dependent dehydrogenase (short-subunit alcohol dehydrogenase family)